MNSEGQMDQKTLDLLRDAGTATISTQLYKRGIRNAVMSDVRTLHGTAFAGPAATVRFVPARDDVSDIGMLGDPDYPQRRAIEHAVTGSVLVFGGGHPGVGMVGGILLARMNARGVTAFVTDGAIRDRGDLGDIGLSICAAGVQPGMHLLAVQAVDADVIVGCGGVQVRPGDVIVGDEDGVVCVPAAIAAEIAPAARRQTQLEAYAAELVLAGASLVGTYPITAELEAEFDASR
jgi:regulator of RNase E activity RraA